MSVDEPIAEIADGSMQLVAGYPALTAGVYRVRTGDQVTIVGGPHAGVTPTLNQHSFELELAAPRLQLASAEIVATAPTDGGRGAFAGVLPHVVLASRSLPWERTVDQPDDDGAARRAAVVGRALPEQPWLAVVVIHGQELDGGHATLASVPAGDAVVGKPAAAPDDDLDRPHLASLEPRDVARPDAADQPRTVDVLDLDRALFDAIVPLPGETALLAHLRHLHLAAGPEDRALTAAAGGGSQLGLFPIVMANRFAATGRNLACLVSLEGHAATSAPATGAGHRARVRLIVLARWTFESLAADDPALATAGAGDDGEPVEGAFASLLRRLDIGPLRPTLAGDVDPALRALAASGHTVLPYCARDHQRTIAVYRGPLAPGPADAGAPAARLPPVLTADAALRFDPALGVFDVGHAAAYELGRLLALRDRTYSRAVIDWRRRNQRPPRRPEPTVLTEPLAHLIAGLERLLGEPASGRGDEVTLTAAPAPTDTRAAPPAPPAPDDGERVSTWRPFAGELPAAIVDWLGERVRLRGVPFDYLVPDERALPEHSLRTFHVDEGWVEALVAGALSPGRATLRDGEHDEEARRQLVDVLHPARDEAGARVRSNGVLLRSRALAGWPGLEVRGYAADDPEHARPVLTLRQDRLSPSVRLVIFEREVRWIELREPPEQIHFGAAADGPSLPMRGGDGLVLDVWATMAALAAGGPSSSAHLARALLRGADRLLVDVGGSP